jgi:rare lipoprotein A
MRDQAALARRYSGRPALAVLHGTATWYSDKLAGRATASGERYDPRGFTAAHRTLPFGTVLRVRATKPTDWVYVRVNDRGPFGRRERILDLSRAAAAHIGLERAGVLPVRAEVVAYGSRRLGSQRLR